MSVKSNIADFERKVKSLADVPRKSAAKALRAGASVVAKAARIAAPEGRNTLQRRRANPKVRLRKSIRVRTKTAAGGNVRVKVSIAAPHGHFVTLGTKPRSRARIGGFLAWRGSLQQRIERSTGTGGVRPNPFFARTVTATETAARERTFEVLDADMQKRFAETKAAK